MLLRRLASAALGIALLVPAAPAEAAAPPAATRSGGQDLTTGRVVVRYRAGTSALTRARAARFTGGRVAVRIRPLDVEVLATRDAAVTAAALTRRGEVLWAQPEVLAQRSAQIGSTPERTELRYADAVTASPLMKATGVKVGVIDDGVWTNTDLTGRLFDGGDCSSGVCAATGAVNAGAGAHGTAVATVLAAANNTVGIVGGAPEAHVHAYRVFPDEQSGASDTAIAAAIVEAAKDNMAVVNMSLGTPFDSRLLREAVAYARATRPNMVLVAAAGNDGAERANYPAGNPYVLAVGAAEPVTGGWRVAGFSTRGDVDLIAPGVNIRAWYTDDDAPPVEPTGTCGTSPQTCVDGTSFASPEVAAIAAGLARAGITGDRARAAILASAKAPTSNTAPLAATGAGRADALAAYTMATGTAAYTATFVDRGAWIASSVGRRRVEVVRVDPQPGTGADGAATLSASEGTVTSLGGSTTTVGSTAVHRSLFEYAAPAAGVIPRNATLTASAAGDSGAAVRVTPLRIVHSTSGPEGVPIGSSLPTTNVTLTYGDRSSYIRTVVLARGQRLTVSFAYPLSSIESLLLVWLPNTVTGGGSHASDIPISGDSSGMASGTLTYVAPVSGVYSFGFMLFSPDDDGVYKMSASVSSANLPFRRPPGGPRKTNPLRPAR